MTTYKSFETERLILRPAQLEDAPFILELMNSPKWIKNIGDRKVRSIEDAEGYIKEKMFPQLERLGHGNFILVRKADGIKIGSCGLYDREGLEGLDIGFALLPAYEKKGYGYEGSKKVRDAGFEEFGIEQISAITTTYNIESQKLLEKLGMKFTKMTKIPNDDEELMMYTLKKGDLNP